MKTCLAIDIGGTKISSAIIVDENITNYQEIPTPKTNGNHEVIKDTLIKLIQTYKDSADFCAIATAGIVTNSGVRAMSPNVLWGHNKFDLKGLVESELLIPTYVLNDAQAAAYCEYCQSNKVNNMAYITVSTGVGGGLVINGELLTGVNGFAGHFGHTISAAANRSTKCNCGRNNCVESIASGTSIAREMKAQTGLELDAKFVFEQYYFGNKVAGKIIEESAQAIADLIADLKISLDVEYVALGGSVGLAERYIDLVRSRLDTMPSNFHVAVNLACSNKFSGLLGVYLWAKNDLR